MRKSGLIVAVVLALGAGMPAVAVAQAVPEAAARSPLFQPLEPLIGRIWRGQATGDQPVVDYARWEWAVGGHAVRVTHALADGSYGGETLIFPDRDTGKLIFHYFTSGGFHTTGTVTPQDDGTLAFEETIHGVPGMTTLRSVWRIGPDGYRTETLNPDGEPFGGFVYADAGERSVPDLRAE